MKNFGKEWTVQRASDDDISYEDAINWVEYNTMRALPYISDKAPIIVSICA